MRIAVTLLFSLACVAAACEKRSAPTSSPAEEVAGEQDERTEQKRESTESESEPSADLDWVPPLGDDLEPMPTVRVPIEGYPARGASAEDARVTIVEFGDYGCPDTHARVGLIEEVLDEHGDRVRFVYRNLVWVPGDYGPFAAKLAHAAGKKDKYWSAYELIWNDFRKLDEKDRSSYLDQLGLESDALEDVGESAEKTAESNETFAEEHAIQWVPTFFVNGIPVAKASDEDFVKLVELQLEKAERLHDQTGETGDELYESLVEANRSAE